MTLARFALLPLVLLCLFGCVRRNSHVSENRPPANPVAHPIAAENAAQAQVAGEMHMVRLLSMACFALALVATFVLRALIPGFAWLGGACAGAFLGVFLLALLTTFALPFLPWVMLAVLLLGGAAALWHFRKWILAPDQLPAVK